MIKRARPGDRGFALVELLMLVTLMALLSVLAIYAFARASGGSRMSEAKNTIGAISRGGIAAFERSDEPPGSGWPDPRGDSHDVCATSNPSIGAIPDARQFMPDASTFETVGPGNSRHVGWPCLRFNITDPTRYRYGYVANGTVPCRAMKAKAPRCFPLAQARTDRGFTAFAEGDPNGKGRSTYAISAEVNTTTRTIKMASQLELVGPDD